MADSTNPGTSDRTGRGGADRCRSVTGQERDIICTGDEGHPPGQHRWAHAEDEPR